MFVDVLTVWPAFYCSYLVQAGVLCNLPYKGDWRLFAEDRCNTMFRHILKISRKLLRRWSREAVAGHLAPVQNIGPVLSMSHACD